MFRILYFLLCCVLVSCNDYSIRCDNPPHIRSDGSNVQKWPDNTIPYEITEVFYPDQKELIRTSLKELSDKTDNCVKFVEKTNLHTAWVRIISQDGCWSRVGKTVDTGSQDLSLSQNGCMFPGTVIHEFLHALGFVHEQTRPDRDDYIKVIYKNVEPDKKSNYDKDPQGKLQSAGLPYDFNSIMHYVYNGFSINCMPVMAPIDPKNKEWRYTMGTGKKLTASDILKVKTIYGCKL